MRGWRALLLTMVLVTGCLGGAPDADDNEVEAASTDAAPSSSAPGTSSASAPSSSAAASGERPTSGEANATLPPVVVPIAFDGSLPAFVEPCAWTLVGGACLALPPSDFQNRYDIEQEGTITSGTLTLTWTASSPVTDQLGFLFSSSTEEEYVEHARVFGPSPLTIELADVELPAGHTHQLLVFAGWTGGFVLVAGAEVAVNPQEQPFSIAGELVLPAPGNP